MSKIFAAQQIVKGLSKVAKSRPKGVNHFLKKYPDVNIREIRVCRKPIKKEFTKIMNWVSGGELEKVKKKYDYDDIFHLYAFLILDNGKKFFVEKNEIVVMKEYRGRIEDKHMDCKNKFVSPMKFKDFVKKAEKSYKNIYLYSAHNDNCQKFVRHLANTLGTKELDSFVMQYNAGEILKGSVKENAKKVTTMANLMARLFGAFSNDFVEDGKVEKKKNKKFKPTIRGKR